MLRAGARHTLVSVLTARSLRQFRRVLVAIAGMALCAPARGGEPAPGVPAQGSVIRADRVTELFRLVLRDDVIELETDLPVSDGTVRVESPELPAGGEITLRDRAVLANGMQIVTFQFNTPPPDTQALLGLTQVNFQLGRLQISQDIAGVRQIELHQSLPTPGSPTNIDVVDANAAATERVRLYVRQWNPLTGQNPPAKQLAAPDFTELQRRHPQEVAQFVVPMLRTLGQERSLLTPDRATVVQVLGNSDPRAQSITARVKELVASLDAPTKEQRDAAERTLQELGATAAAVLMTLDRSTRSAEQNSRLDLLLADHAPLTQANANALKDDRMFLVNCLYLDDPDLRDAALARLRELTGKPLSFSATGAESEQLSAIAQVRDTVLRAPATPSP